MFEETEWLIVKFMAYCWAGNSQLTLGVTERFPLQRPDKGTKRPLPHTVLQNRCFDISESVVVYAFCILDF